MSCSFAVSSSLRREFVNPVSHVFFAPARIYQPRSKCEISRRGFAFKGIVAAGVSVVGSSLVTEPAQGVERLQYKPEGYNYWTWKGHKIHYVVQGEGFPIVLIHGFGASAFHWRYNIPELAKRYKVYAIDLLGFGWSEKAIIEYDAMVWRNQIVDFLKEIVKEPAVVVGNSLGGFTALVAAAGLPEQVAGVALLNSAGQFGDATKGTNQSEETIFQKFFLKPLKEIFQRVVLGLLFWQAKQPARIVSVLKSVSHLLPNFTRPLLLKTQWKLKLNYKSYLCIPSAIYVGFVLIFQYQARLVKCTCMIMPVVVQLGSWFSDYIYEFNRIMLQITFCSVEIFYS